VTTARAWVAALGNRAALDTAADSIVDRIDITDSEGSGPFKAKNSSASWPTRWFSVNWSSTTR